MMSLKTAFNLNNIYKISLFLQCLDGFLLTAFTDGTIVYSTENVLQYLGFNQVNLSPWVGFNVQ